MARNCLKIPLSELILLINHDPEVTDKYKKIATPSCELCGKEFIANRTDQRCCSKECMRKLFEKENLKCRNNYKSEWAKRKRLEAKLCQRI